MLYSNNEDKSKKTNWNKVKMVLVVIAFALVIIKNLGLTDKIKQMNFFGYFTEVIGITDSTPVQAAKQILEKELPSPSKINYISSRIISEKQSHYLVHLEYDNQNVYGATIRGSTLVVFQMKNDNKQFDYSPVFALSESSNPPTSIEIDIMKQANGWPSIP